jgi:hypothetical protein
VKQTITVNSAADLKQFKREFGELVDIVRRADGKYILYVTKADTSPGAQSIFITKREFDLALSPAMRTGSPAAFAPNVAGGRFLPHRLDSAYSAYQRAQAQADITDTVPGSAMIRNREQFLAVYGEKFGYFPPGRMGDFLNAATTAALRK